MKPIDRPGSANVGEFSPMYTPENTGEYVTIAADTAMNHSKNPVDTSPTGSMTKAWHPNTVPVRK